MTVLISGGLRGDSKTLKKLTNSGYYAHLQSLLKNRSPNQNYVWKQYWDVKPAKIVSIRAIDGHLGRGVPKFGNRLVIQALVRFDTMQVRRGFAWLSVDPKTLFFF
jgi:hypothetical protein